MQEQRNNAVKRIVYASVMIIAAALLIFAHHEIYKGVNYRFQHEQASNLSHQHESTPDPLEGIDEPTDLSHIIHLTLGGNCTPAAILGSNSFGTFNLMAEEEGGAVFFQGLNEVFAEDDCTVLGCAAVFSSKELSFDETGSEELPLLGSPKNAEVFSLGGVELLSLEHARSKAYGETGLADTKSALTEGGLRWIDGETPYILEKFGIRIGILCAQIPVEADPVSYTEAVAAADKDCDYVILYAEREATEVPYYTELARTLIDSGCDLVCWTGAASENGPRAEAYNGGIIVDSLGYLLDGSTYSASDTALYSVSVSVNKNVIEQVEGELIPVTFPESPWLPCVE